MFWQTIQPAIIILSVGLSAAILIGVIKTAVYLPRKLIRTQDEASAKDEAAIIKEMFGKLNRLEVRIESLETIIVESQRKPR